MAEFEEKEEEATGFEEGGEKVTELVEKEEEIGEVEEERETGDELGLVGLEEEEDDGERTEVGSDRELTVGSIDAMGVLAGDAAIEVTVEATPFVDMTMG